VIIRRVAAGIVIASGCLLVTACAPRTTGTSRYATPSTLPQWTSAQSAAAARGMAARGAAPTSEPILQDAEDPATGTLTYTWKNLPYWASLATKSELAFERDVGGQKVQVSGLLLGVGKNKDGADYSITAIVGGYSCTDFDARKKMASLPPNSSTIYKSANNIYDHVSCDEEYWAICIADKTSAMAFADFQKWRPVTFFGTLSSVERRGSGSVVGGNHLMNFIKLTDCHM